MKKKLAVIILLVLITSIFKVNEKSIEAVINKVDLSLNYTEKSNSDEYIFQDKGISIKMNEVSKNVLDKLGKEKQYFESQSCAFPGLDKVYTYNSFEITTYPKNNVDYIASVFFLDDTIKTAEGVYLNQTLEEMKKIYGENFKETQGIYTYERGKSTLSFMIKNNKIVQIEYRAIYK